MKAKGFTIDEKNIARGLYAMIKDHPDGACLSLGMLPAQIMESFDNELRRKIPDVYMAPMDIDPNSKTPYTDAMEERDGKALRHEITRAVCSEIYSLAKEEGVLIV